MRLIGIIIYHTTVAHVVAITKAISVQCHYLNTIVFGRFRRGSAVSIEVNSIERFHMTNNKNNKYIKLCELARVTKQGGCSNDSIRPEDLPCKQPCHRCADFYTYYPEFTADKQLELLLLLAHSKKTIDLKLYNFGNKIVILLDANSGTPYSASGKDITEVLCKLVVDLINNKLLSTNEVKEIIEE